MKKWAFSKGEGIFSQLLTPGCHGSLSPLLVTPPCHFDRTWQIRENLMGRGIAQLGFSRFRVIP